MKKEINVNGPDYRGAPMPRFNAMMINESRFSDDERCKEAYIVFNSADKSEVEWLCQVADHHTNDWSEEVKRAFQANGAKAGHIIDVKFGSRDTGFVENFELIVE